MSNQHDNQSPATKKDIQQLAENMQNQITIILQFMQTLASKEDLQEVKEDLQEVKEELQQVKKDALSTKQELLFMDEQVQSNLTDVIRDSASVTEDKFENHEKRIHVLEMRI